MYTRTKNPPQAPANGQKAVVDLSLARQPFSFENFLTLSLFCTVIFYGAIRVAEACINNKSSVTEQEARETKTMPRLRNLRKDLPLFAPAFESYFIDHFPERYTLASIRNQFLLTVLSTSGHADVGVGTSGWLYYFPVHVFHAQINYPPFSRLNLALWKKAIKARNKFLADNGIKYLLMVVPEKATVYPEYFPPGLAIHSGKSRLDEFQDALANENSDRPVDFIDLKRALIEQKGDKYLLYKKYDAHWNFYGALVCARLIGLHMQDSYPMARFFDRNDFPVTLEKSEQGDLASALALCLQLPEFVPVVDLGKTGAKPMAKTQVPYYGLYHEGSYGFSQENSALPKAFMIHDSYVRYYMMPMIAQLCRSVQFHWTQDFDTERILEQKPDLFIEEMAERHLFDTDPPNVPDLVTVTRKSTFVDATIGDSAGHPAIASYDDRIELVDAAIDRTEDGYRTKLLWRADRDLKLDKAVEIFILDKDGHEVGKKHYREDFLSRPVKAGDAWVDTIDLEQRHLPDGARIAVVLLAQRGGCLPVQAKTTDWFSTRILLDASSLATNWQAFEQNYRLR
ncbi:MAG: hypothetical protein P4L53_26995 [Candidatus Obscuribacterales bacterium]|nr:hypothetical protein [Candidatus Obscuribacterales bacterium]